MLRRKNKPQEAVREAILSDRLSFLDVIVEACQHSGRYTVIAESGDQTYTVMIDRGGPFNVDGGGLTGSAALVKASTLREGSFSVIEGWPVYQPVYQLGLAEVLQGLMLGTKPAEVQLPPARGVDAMRNSPPPTAAPVAPSDSGKGPDPFARPATNGAGPDPFAQSARNVDRLPPFVHPAGPWQVAEAAMPRETPMQVRPAAPHPFPPETPSSPVEAAAPVGTLVQEPAPAPPPTMDLVAAEAPEAPVVPVAAPAAPEATEATEAPLEAIEARPEVIEAAPEPFQLPPAADAEPAASDGGATSAIIATADPEDTDTFLREAARAAAVDPADAAPAAPNPPGFLKRRVLKGLLWTVEVDDDPEHYTMGQALGLLGRSLVSAVVSPITRPFVKRAHQTREDWRRSGEVTSRQKRRRTQQTTKAGKFRR